MERLGIWVDHEIRARLVICFGGESPPSKLLEMGFELRQPHVALKFNKVVIQQNLLTRYTEVKSREQEKR